MKYLQFKDLKTGESGIVLNILNKKGDKKKESKDMVVKFFSKDENCYLFRFKDYEEVELKEIKEKEYKKIIAIN